MIETMEELWQRIRKARAHARLTQQQIADLFDIKRESVAQWESARPENRTECPLQKLQVIAAKTKVDPNWLINNSGDPPGIYKNQTTTAADGIKDLDNVCAAPNLAYAYPLISWVQAGAFGEAIDNYHPGDGEEWIRSPVMMSKHGFALRVVGHSMEPNFPPGRIILVDPELRGGVVPGDFVIARMCNTNEVTFKRFDRDAGRPILIPLNAQYQAISENFEIVGKVVADMNIY